MLFRIENATSNNFFNNLRNIENLLVEYQRDLIEFNKIQNFEIIEISSEKRCKKYIIFIILEVFRCAVRCKSTFLTFWKTWNLHRQRSRKHTFFVKKLFFEHFVFFFEWIGKIPPLSQFLNIQKTIFSCIFQIIWWNTKFFMRSLTYRLL